MTATSLSERCFLLLYIKIERIDWFLYALTLCCITYSVCDCGNGYFEKLELIWSISVDTFNSKIFGLYQAAPWAAKNLWRFRTGGRPSLAEQIRRRLQLMKYLQQPMDFPLLSCYLLAQHPSSFAAFPAPISLASFTACTLYSFSYFLCSCAILYTVLTLVILFLFCELEVSTFLYLIRSSPDAVLISMILLFSPPSSPRCWYPGNPGTPRTGHTGTPAQSSEPY